MNIAIIDDISTDAEALKNIAVSYFEKKQIRAEICHFFRSEDSPIAASLFLSLPAVILLWKAMM